MTKLLTRIRFELGSGRALTNARVHLDETERTLAAIDALGARLAASTAVRRAA